MSWIKEGAKILLITLFLFMMIDFVSTWLHGARGFSKFFISNTIEGRHNKPMFAGGFGSLLDEFHGTVNIGGRGERLSDPISCGNVVSKVLFIGDSTTAGFEVDDNKTFVSLFNKECIRTKISGTNFGVRAHDTHAVIGTYERTSSLFPHDYVVYLMTDNDFEENLDPHSYFNMTRRFGRLFEGELIEPDDDLLWSTYASIRMFVADRLALTTALIKLVQTFQINPINEVGLEPATDTTNQAYKAYELLEKLAIMVEGKGAELIVMPYPQLVQAFGDDRNKKIKLLSSLISENLESVLYVDNLDSMVKTKVLIDAKQLSEMRFKTDLHLSDYGHQIIAQVLLDIFRNLKSVAK